MGQCIQVKKNGDRCKAQAIEGAEYCAYHLKRLQEGAAEPVAPSVDPVPPAAPSVEEAKVPAIHNKLHPKKIRYIGRGTYAIPSENVYFTRPGQEEEVSHDCWERLLSKRDTREVFEEV